VIISSVNPNILAGKRSSIISSGNGTYQNCAQSHQDNLGGVLQNEDGDTFALSNLQNGSELNTGYSQYSQRLRAVSDDSVLNVKDAVTTTFNTDTNTGYAQYAQWSGTDTENSAPDIVGTIVAKYNPDSNTGIAAYAQQSGKDPDNCTTITGLITVDYNTDTQRTKV
jgi:hypothetical protein